MTPDAMPTADRSHLLTEQRLPESMKLDAMPIADAMTLVLEQDRRAVEAVASQKQAIVRAVEIVSSSLRSGGRLIYVGAGTSGRLGVLDAAECPPTFRTEPDMVQGIIAGGDAAMFRAQEGAEDSEDGGANAVDEKSISGRDVILGIAAGGTTPFVHGALRRARDRGAKTIFLTCIAPFPDEPEVDLVIRPLTGPEIVTGSTRLKAGTATKLVLNAITTLTMVQLGKVYENLMIDLKATNSKLRDRAARIVATLTDLPREEAFTLIDKAAGHVKVAVVMVKRGVSADEARSILAKAGGRLRAAIEK
ncbi:MAG TPA: N-acetylmuramic acid 6-phosphate etherase [Tepidisphaeraceae bacterium]|jgi:N-acetylmuramic acid 6-phosphate etherase|nr:N-acetylmuramic acid 6-phosphate etherase [Tepidisphaeraceae bacterium]